MNTQKKFGYVRISSKDQNEARQIASIKEFGINDRDIFIDKKSGKDFNREQYKVLKKVLRQGDILYIHELERFGRNKEEILNEWNEITKVIKADIVVINMPLLDTTKYKDSLGTFIADLVLQILSWMAEKERTRIRIRQKEGIDIAKKNGVKLGRPSAKITNEFIAAYDKWKAGEIQAVDAMKLSKTTKSTFYNLVKRYEKEQ